MILAQAVRGPLTTVLEAPKRRVARGETVELTLTLQIAPGYRIESVRSVGGAARATSVQLGMAEGLVPGAMRCPEGSVAPLGGERMAAYLGTVAIHVPVSVSPDCLAGTAPIAARVLFQATSDAVLPPDEVEVRGELDVAAP